ncbi:trans-sialidase, putative, partial [Trypanosoma cruzi marinkellei]
QLLRRVPRLTPSAALVRSRLGLVGFLSGNFSDKTWRDEYLGVNATVNNDEAKKKATKTSDGVKFQGAWAEWPVGKQGENQLYHFANYNFTLVATVSIHNVPKSGSVPLMGAVMNDTANTVHLGLSYKGGGKWILLCNGTKANGEHSSTLHSEADKAQYHVAIVLQNGTQGTAYVDGKRVEDAKCELENKEDKNVSHFYIGGDGGIAGNSGSREDVSVTVTNVLLYNRPLDINDINALKPKDVQITPPKVEKAQKLVSPSSSVKPQPAGQELSSGNNGGNGGIASDISRVRFRQLPQE